jgi:hypothetical protein
MPERVRSLCKLAHVLFQAFLPFRAGKWHVLAH